MVSRSGRRQQDCVEPSVFVPVSVANLPSLARLIECLDARVAVDRRARGVDQSLRELCDPLLVGPLRRLVVAALADLAVAVEGPHRRVDLDQPVAR